MKIDLNSFVYNYVAMGIQLAVVDTCDHTMRPLIAGDAADVCDWLDDYKLSYYLRWIEPNFTNGGLILKVEKY